MKLYSDKAFKDVGRIFFIRTRANKKAKALPHGARKTLHSHHHYSKNSYNHTKLQQTEAIGAIFFSNRFQEGIVYRTSLFLRNSKYATNVYSQTCTITLLIVVNRLHRHFVFHFHRIWLVEYGVQTHYQETLQGIHEHVMQHRGIELAQHKNVGSQTGRNHC